MRPTFILNLDCPCSEYDITFEPTKSYVEFKDWSTVISCLQHALDEVWGPLCSGLAGHSGTRLSCPSQPCPLDGVKAIDELDMEEDPLTSWFKESKQATTQNDERLRPRLLSDFERSPLDPDPFDTICHEPQILPCNPEPLLGFVKMDVTIEGPRREDQLAGLAFEEDDLDREHAMEVDWESPSQVSKPFQVQWFDSFDSRRPRSGLEQGVANRSPTPVTPSSPSFSELDYAQEYNHFRPAVHPAKSPFRDVDIEDRMRGSTPSFDAHLDPQWDLFEPVQGYSIAARSQHDASSGTEHRGRKADQSKLGKAPRLRSAQGAAMHGQELLDPHFLKQAGTGRRKTVEDRAWTAASSRKKRRREDSHSLPRRPQSAPPFARPKKRYGPESGASLAPSDPSKGNTAGTRIAQASPEAASLTKWRTSRDNEEVQDMYKAWQNPCFRAADSDILELEIDSHPNIVPKEISSDMLQRLRVFQQLDRKFIAAVAGNTLVIIDQHAADERVRLEELKEMVLGVKDSETTTSSNLLKEAIKLALTPADEQVLRTHKRVVEQWGWNYTFERLPTAAGIWNKAPGHRGQVLLTAVPRIQDATLTAPDLLEYVQQLQDTQSTSSVPPSIIRLLNSKACRGAIMFGDSLLPGECLQLLKHLQRTHLPFQCAHGRPTMVPLVNLSVFARKYLATAPDADNARSSQRGRNATGTLKSGGTESAARSTAARGLFQHAVALSRARSRLQRAEE
ncbi:DNA mismatch repair protein [Klebsormidium nitens]|uniref:DNA mismatch repair protein n=1 Tax=Klebsormidium nitens TaxID=105231 RepID=A0A1Y1I7M7_KLENI|nr:DNA mismatch repair protein [Klebsormidium nitens]|eukprot:GAQ85942.1 DNA mismatch repair protein [Klebsormidium nitens]